MESTSVEVALDRIGFGSVQVQLIVIGALILLTALNETLGTSFLLPSACDFALSTSDKGFLSGMTFLGVTVSSYFWGFLGDTQGRKWVIFNALLFSSIFSITSAFVSNFTVFVVCRFMVGVWWDEFPSIQKRSRPKSAYSKCFRVLNDALRLHRWIQHWQEPDNDHFLDDCVDRTCKYFHSTWVQCFYLKPPIFSMNFKVSAMWILSFEWSFVFSAGYIFRPWRLLMIVYALPGVIALLWLINFKESPRFLLSRHQHDKALAVMQWVMRTNGRREDEGFAIKSLELDCEMQQKTSAGDNKDK